MPQTLERHEEAPSTTVRMRHALASEKVMQLLGQDGAFEPVIRNLRQRAETSSPVLQARLDALAEEVVMSRPDRKGGRADYDARNRANVKLLALNFYDLARTAPLACTSVPCAKEWYSASGKGWRNPAMSYRSTVDVALRGLVRLGYAAVIRKGSPDNGHGTLVRATRKLIEYLEHDGVPEAEAFHLGRAWHPIRLKDADGAELAVPETPETARWRANLEHINDANRRCSLSLGHLTEDEREELGDIILADTGLFPDATGLEQILAGRSLHRVFNVTLEAGGRFYGGFWQMLPGRWRRRLTINGEPVVEGDFVAMLPRMLYHGEGLEAPDEPYADLAPVPRKIAKLGLIALVNMTAKQVRSFKGFDEAMAGMSWRDFVDHVAAVHAPIAHLLRRGRGLAAQRRDSEVAERVMLDFAMAGIPCLGVHDSFLVAERHADRLVATMKAAYRDLIGAEGRVETKLGP